MGDYQTNGVLLHFTEKYTFKCKSFKVTLHGSWLRRPIL